MTWILVGIGGGLGAVLRHAMNTWLHGWLLSTTFPAGILVVNVLGSLVIGLLAGGLAGSRFAWSAETRVFFFVGVLGGFTTFSSFTLDTLTLVRGGDLVLAALNVAGQVVLGLVAVGVGYRLGLMV
jgi:fluoride exporter